MIELPSDNTQFGGDMGELIFGHWCRSIRANPMKVDFDELGIDFTVTFPSESGRVVALDLIEPEFVCRIQVKATDSPKDTAYIKLGKWLNLVNDYYPAFVLLINYDRKKAEQERLSGNPNYDDLPVGAYLMPINEGRIAYVLRELRAADTADVLASRKPMKALPTERIFPNGNALREAIRSHVGNYAEYGVRKQLFRKSVGYTDKRRMITTDIKWTEEMQCDFVLGFPVPATLVKIEDIRFEVPKEESIDDPAVQLRGPNRVPPVAEVTIGFAGDSFPATATFQTTMHHPLTVLPHLSKYKVLFKSGPLDLVLSEGVVRITCSLDPHAPLDFWLNTFVLMHLCAAGPVRMSMQHGSAQQDQIVTVPPQSTPPALLDLKIYKSIECAVWIAESFGKDVGDVALAPIANAFEPIGILFGLLRDAGQDAQEWQFTESELDSIRGKHIAIILTPGVQIGSWHFSAAVVIHGRIPQETPSGNVTLTSSCEVVAKFARPGEDGKPPIKPLIDAAEAWIEERGMHVYDIKTLRFQSRI